MENPFTTHPRSVGQTYGEHMAFALAFARGCFAAGGIAVVHAVFPFVWPTAAGDRVRGLYRKLEEAVRPRS